MAEVTTRGGGLPRSGLRGRGRGRGGSNFNSAPHSNISTNGFTSKVNGHRPYQARPSTHSPPNDEPEELRLSRKKHGQKLATIRELFPTWTDEDLLMALNEASGDLELAATRISEGLAEQWGSVKSKKDKKVVPSATQALSHPRTQHSAGVNNVGTESSRGTRGRTDISRGTTRGGGRGAAPRGSGRGQWATGSSRPSPAIGNDSSTATATPSAWNLGPPASLGTPALSSDVPTAEPVPVASVESEYNEADLLPPTSTAEENKPASLLRDLNAAPAELHPNGHTPEPLKRPASRVIPPGTKMSWAQIARPTEPPKPQPVPVVRAPPSQPVLASEADMSGDTIAPSVLEPISPPENIEPSAAALLADKQVTITIPDASADVWHTEPVPAIDNLKNDVATTGPNVWNDDPVPAPLGVGEGWAETVLARPNDQASIFDSQVTNSKLLTPSDAINIAPIEMSTPVSSSIDVSIPSTAIAQDQGTQTVPETVSIHVTPASQPGVNMGMSAPPGLSKRANPRKGQEAAVVMPGSGTPNVDRIGLKFGSLSLFDEASGSEVDHAPPQDAPSPPVTSMDKIVAAETTLKAEELSNEKPITPPQPAAEQLAPPSPPSVAPVVEEKLAPQPVPTIVHTSPLQSHANPQSQAPAAQPPSSAFASRYPANTQYSAPEPSSTAHPASSLSHPQAQTQAQPQQQQQQQVPPQQDAFLHYPGFRQDPMAAYFQQQGQQQQPQQQSVVGQHSSSPAPASQSSAYGAFNHMSQQQQQQAQQHQQQLQQQLPPQSQQPTQPGFGQTPQTAQEYASLYGQEALRSLGYYDSYSHAQAAQAAFQSRSPHGGEDASKSTVSNPNQAAGPPGQPQAVAQHQQPAVAAVSAANQQYPGMQASPMPYPYYPYYQQYGQLPPSYQNPAYPYGMQAPSPYYSVQGSQQYPVSAPRSGQSQYSIQAGPGNTGGTAGNPLPSSHHQQPQHGSQHTLGGGVGLVGNSGFRQVSQPGVGGSQLPGSQVTGQGVVVGSGLVAPGSTTGGVQGGQQPSSMQQHHAYYGSNYGYGDSQQAQQGAIGAGHHHSQQPPQSNNRHSHHQGGGGQGGQVGLGGPGGQGGNGNDRKDPFNTFSSDRFFGQ